MTDPEPAERATPDGATAADPCKQCDRPVGGDRFYAPGYCSDACYYRYRGSPVVRDIRRVSWICGVCFRIVAEGKGPDRTPTRHATRVVDEHERADYQREYRPARGCECGAISLSDRDDILEVIERDGILDRLYAHLERMASRGNGGAFDGANPDRGAFDAALREFDDGSPAADEEELAGALEYAVGRALYADGNRDAG